MTSREEIELLLNKTGRTLEGLPTLKDYRNRDLKTICEAMQACGIYETFPFIMHQFDVIELLVGALRDALDKTMQKPLTYYETLESEAPVWAESKIEGVLDDWFYVYGGDEEEAELLGFGDDESLLKPKQLYNKTWRCWASRPTSEEREAAAWEN